MYMYIYIYTYVYVYANKKQHRDALDNYRI